MPPWTVAAAILLLGLAVAGCADEPPAEEPAGTQAWPTPGGPLPTTSKEAFQSVRPQLVSVLPVERQARLAVPAGEGTLQVALDLQTDGYAPLVLRLYDAAGTEVQRHDLEEAGKFVLTLGPGGGPYDLGAMSEATWDIGMVLTAFPDGFDLGTPLYVSTPQQQSIEHRFYPELLRIPAAQPWRITLFDYDPHAGTANLQHNLHFPQLGLRTEGKTTWGEVRVLDLPALAAGSYAFECQFHGFSGTLQVG